VGFLCVWGLMKPFKFYFTLVINVLKVIFDSSCLSPIFGFGCKVSARDGLHLISELQVSSC